MKIYRMPRGKMASHLIMAHGIMALTLMGVAGALSIGAAILVDVRIVVIFFLIVCIIAPMVMIHIYLSHALRPATALNLLPHTLHVEGEEIAVTLYQIGEEEEYEAFRTIRYPLGWLGRYQIGGNYVSIPVANPGEERHGNLGWLYLPLNAFDTDSSFRHFLSQIYPDSPRAEGDTK